MESDKREDIVLNKQDCTGCSACALKCPTHAISMEYNNEGFLYPNVDMEKCISCGLCSKVCHLDMHVEDTIDATSVYAAINKNVNTLLESSSGGVFSVVAEHILKYQGVCYGVSLDGLKAEYLRVQDKEDLCKLFGSKYFQVDNGDIYNLVEKDCKEGKEVLFVGTPCLVAGLKQFLKRDYKNLYTIDIVCHGTPSMLYFEKYIEYVEGKIGGKIIDFNFRDKSKYGVGCISSCTIRKKDKLKKIVLTNQLLNYYYYYMFADSYRDSCYHCKYTNLNRVSDITLGDFWGIEKLNSKLDVRHGCSAVIVNSLKGEFLLHNVISKQCYLEKRTINEILVRNAALQINVSRPTTRDTMYSELIGKGFSYMVNTRYKPSVIQYFKGVAKGLLPAFIQNLIHRYR